MFAGSSQADESKGRENHVEERTSLGASSHRPHVVVIISKYEHGFLAQPRVTASRVKTTHNGVPSHPVPLAHRDDLGISPHPEPATHHPFPSVEIEEVPGRHREKLTSFGTDVDRVDVDITLLHPVHEITRAKPNGTGCLVIRRYDDPIAWVIEFKPALLRARVMAWNRLGLRTQCANEKTPDGINQPGHIHLLGAFSLMAYPANPPPLSRERRSPSSRAAPTRPHRSSAAAVG